jgi:hypothetical protein
VMVVSALSQRTAWVRIVDDAHEAQHRSPPHPGGIETTVGGHTTRRGYALLWRGRFAVGGADLLSGARCRPMLPSRFFNTRIGTLRSQFDLDFESTISSISG